MNKTKIINFNIKSIFNNSLAKGSLVYTISSVINAAIPFFLLPILTRVLTPEDYGIVSIYTMLVSIYNIFMGLNLHGAINREYFNKDINFKVYVFNCIFVTSVAFSIISLISFIFSSQISNITKFPSQYIWNVIITSLFMQFLLLLLSIYQAQKKAIKYSIFQIVQTVINFTLSIILVVLLKQGWQGRLWANLIAYIIFGVVALIVLFLYYSKFKISINYILKSLKFGAPLLPHSLGGMLIAMWSRFVIANSLGLTETGLFTAAFQIASILTIIEDSFNRAYAPWLYEKLNLNNEQIKLKIVKFTYLYFASVFIFALFLGISSPYIVKILLGKDFTESAPIIIWIALGTAFNGMYYMVTNYIFYTYKTHILANITIFCGILNIPLTVFLTRINGTIGAGQSYAIIQFLFFILTWILSSMVYKMPWFKLRY